MRPSRQISPSPERTRISPAKHAARSAFKATRSTKRNIIISYSESNRAGRCIKLNTLCMSTTKYSCLPVATVLRKISDDTASSKANRMLYKSSAKQVQAA